MAPVPRRETEVMISNRNPILLPAFQNVPRHRFHDVSFLPNKTFRPQPSCFGAPLRKSGALSQPAGGSHLKEKGIRLLLVGALVDQVDILIPCSADASPELLTPARRRAPERA